MGIIRILTPEEVKEANEKAQKRCHTFRLICFKIPLYLWLTILLLLFLWSKCNFAFLLFISIYPGMYIWGWLLIWHFVTRNWKLFL